MGQIYLGEMRSLCPSHHPNDPAEDECAGSALASDLWHASETVRYHLEKVEKLLDKGDFAAAQVEFDKIAEVTL